MIATLLGEERSVTTLKTAVQQTTFRLDFLRSLGSGRSADPFPERQLCRVVILLIKPIVAIVVVVVVVVVAA